jgi:hypothetical protein
MRAIYSLLIQIVLLYRSRIKRNPSSKFAQIRRSDHYLRDIAPRRVASCTRPGLTPSRELLEELEGFLHLVWNRSQRIVQRVADLENHSRRSRQLLERL